MAELNRRSFLKTSSTVVGGLVVGFYLPEHASAGTAALDAKTDALVNTWVRISPNNVATIYLQKSEFGQGTYTSLPMLLAEEAELDWSKVRVEFAPSTGEYINLKAPMTGGSKSIRLSFDSLRSAGAAIKEMMLAAAAAKWKVPAAGLQAKLGFVIDPKTKKKLSYGSLAAAAAKMPVPEKPKLKDASEFTIIGTPKDRLDVEAKVTGKAVYGMDVVVPGMMFAAVKTAPVFGGDVANFKELSEQKIPGVHAIVKVPNGIAVVAQTTWHAQKALDGLDVKFTDGPKPSLNNADVKKTLAAGLKEPGLSVVAVGDADKVLKAAKNKVTAEYSVPFLAHAQMETMNCTASVQGDKCEVWAPTQSPHLCKVNAGTALSIPPDNVTVHQTFIGGSFGRRLDRDFVVQSVLIAKAVGKPVKMTWSREQDMASDYFRPACTAQLEGSLDANGKLEALSCKVVNDSILARFNPSKIEKGLDSYSVDGLKEIFYTIPNYKLNNVTSSTGVPVGFWRSVGFSQNTFYMESFLDELAHSAKIDPYEFRRSLFVGHARELAVLDKVAEMSNWKQQMAGENKNLGIAFMGGYGSFAAQVVQVAVDDHGAVKVEKIWCAVDCGTVVNPKIVEAQIRGGAIFGLGAALFNDVEIKDGRAAISNFDNYRVLKMRDIPEIAVTLIESKMPVGGVGEPGTPIVAPAIANAIFAKTGYRVRSLPFSAHDLKEQKVRV